MTTSSTINPEQKRLVRSTHTGGDQTNIRVKLAAETRNRAQFALQMPEQRHHGSKRLDRSAEQRQCGREDVLLGECRPKAFKMWCYPKFFGSSTPDPLFQSTDFTSSILLRNFVAGSILSVLSVSRSIAIAALIFTGPLLPFLPAGVGIFLMGNALTVLLVAMASGYRALGPTPKIGHSPIFAAMAISIVTIMDGAPPEAMAATVICTILVATFMTGALMTLMGMLRLGTLARSIPYPVIGGFIAGLGYLIIRGGVSVALGPNGSISEPMTLLEPLALMHVIPALIFAAVLFVLSKRLKHWSVLPILLIVVIISFHIVVLISGSSHAQAAASGWLAEFSSDSAGTFPPITFSQLALVDFTAVAMQSGTVLLLIFLSLISLLLGVGSIEVAVDRDLDPNREMIAAGVGNMVGGLAASALSFHTLSQTTLGHKLGGDRFLMNVFYVLIVIIAIIFGPSLTSMVPLFLLGGLLIYTGIGSLMDWCWNARKKLPLQDYLVVLAILLVVAFYGLLEGVGFGLGMSVLLFVRHYSKISILHAQMKGSDYRSNIDRAPAQMEFLDNHAHEVHIYLLRGFIFFASANQLLEKTQALLKEAPATGLLYVVIDLSRVEGLDSSALNSLTKMMQTFRRMNISLIMTAGRPETVTALRGLKSTLKLSNQQVCFADTLDEGVGQFQDRMLAGANNIEEPETTDVAAFLATVLGDRESVMPMASYFTNLTLHQGEVLFRQGDLGDALFLIQKGAVAISIELSDRSERIVRTIRTGAILGEMSVYTGESRTATVRAVEETVLLQLSSKALTKMRQDPDVPEGIFDAHIITLLADRLARANREIAALAD